MYIEFIDYNSNAPYFKLSFDNGVTFYCKSESFTVTPNDLFLVYSKDAPIPSWLENVSFKVDPVYSLNYTDVSESIVNYFTNYVVPSGSDNVFELKAHMVPKIYDKLFYSFVFSKDLLLIEVLKTLYPDDGFVSSLYNLFFTDSYTKKYCVYKFYFELFASVFEISPGVKLRDYILSNMSSEQKLLYDNATTIISTSGYVQSIKNALGLTDSQVDAIFSAAVKFMFSNYDNY